MAMMATPRAISTTAKRGRGGWLVTERPPHPPLRGDLSPKGRGRVPYRSRSDTSPWGERSAEGRVRGPRTRSLGEALHNRQKRFAVAVELGLADAGKVQHVMRMLGHGERHGAQGRVVEDDI